MRSCPHQRGGKCKYQRADTHWGHGIREHYKREKSHERRDFTFLGRVQGKEPNVQVTRRPLKAGNSGLENEDRDINPAAKKSGTVLAISNEDKHCHA